MSPYIAQELTFARRARLPRLIFVEDEIIGTFDHVSPDEPVAFTRTAPQADRAEHLQRIAEFVARMQVGASHQMARTGLRKAAVFLPTDENSPPLEASLAEVLRRETFQPQMIECGQWSNYSHGMSALDAILACEVSVYCLSRELTSVDVALAEAHALCRPAIRLQCDPESLNCEPDLQGVMRWKTFDLLRPTLLQQLQSYRKGFVEVVALSGQPTVREMVLPDWDAGDPASLSRYVLVDDPHLRQDVNPVRQLLNQGFQSLVVGKRHDDICRAFFDRIQSYNWVYDFEPPAMDYSRQRIRSPREMHSDTAGTCLDFACFFAALLEHAQANPVVARVRWLGGAHALVGSFVNNRPGQTLLKDKGYILEMVQNGDLVLFDATGAARKDNHELGETERHGGFLTYEQSRSEAIKCLERSDVRLDFLLDVLAAR
jgi:hypothetical protein